MYGMSFYGKLGGPTWTEEGVSSGIIKGHSFIFIHSLSLFLPLPPTGFHITEAGFKLPMQPRIALILSPLASECWNYRNEPPCLLEAEVGIKSRASCMLGKRSNN